MELASASSIQQRASAVRVERTPFDSDSEDAAINTPVAASDEAGFAPAASSSLSPADMDLSSSQTDLAPNRASPSPAAAGRSSRPEAPTNSQAVPSPASSSTSSHAPSPSSAAAAAAASHSSHSAAAASVPAASVPLDLPAMRELPLIKLGKSPKDRMLYEQLGDLYSLIVTTEHIELAYVRDAITEQAYTSTCAKLIAQYKTLRESMGSSAPELDAFCRDYNLECRAGENRLRVGVPATVVHGDGGSSSGGGKKMEVAVFHAVQHFITMMDSLKLNMRAVDELHPTLTELVDSVNKVPGLPPDHESKAKTVQWLTTLHQMKAHEELNEEQVRQMSFDLDSAYNGQCDTRSDGDECVGVGSGTPAGARRVLCSRANEPARRNLELTRVSSFLPVREAFHRFVQGK